VGIAVIIPSWNSLEVLPACLESLYSQSYPPQSICIIDNGSTDGTAEWLQENAVDAEVLFWPENRGFSVACNEGIRKTDADYVFLLNADTRLHQDCLLNLSRAAQEHENTSFSPKIFRSDGKTLDSTGLLLRRRRFSPKDRGENETDEGQYDSDVEIFGPCGAAALFPREMLESAKVDGEYLDEDFFAYYEDVDLAWRLRRMGFSSRLIAGAHVYHERGNPGTAGGSLFARAYANRYLYWIKNATCLDALLDLPIMIPIELIRLIRITLHCPCALKFIPLLLKSLPKAISKRRKLSSRFKAKAKELRRWQ
jgi:GT2 family glycosyltransferase